MIVANIVLNERFWFTGPRMLINVNLKRWNGIMITRSMLVRPRFPCYSWLFGGCRGGAG